MRVLGIDPIQRLVAPRAPASTFVALLLNGLVSAIVLLAATCSPCCCRASTRVRLSTG